MNMKFEDTNNLIDTIKWNLANKQHQVRDQLLDNSIAPYRKAAVLAAFLWIDTEWHLLFTRRSDSLKNHKGQVSFPGGAMDVEDYSPVETALRETYEEIGVTSEKIKIIGKMEPMVTTSNFLVTPVLAIMKWPIKFTISAAEVSKVFTIPLSWLANSKNWEERIYNHPSGWYGSVIFYEKFGGELLWGITASITRQIINLTEK